MEEMSPSLSVPDAKGHDSTFVDYKRFEGDAEHRAQQRDQFVRGEVWAPEYDYPHIDSLYDRAVGDSGKGESFLIDRKADIQRAIYRLELAKQHHEIDPNEAELYAAFHELRIKKIMLIEAARRLPFGSGAEQETARRVFMELNAEIYGEIDKDTYLGMLHTERERVDGFEAQNQAARDVKAYLERFFADKELTDIEAELLEPELLNKLRSYVDQHYADILAVVPDDDETVVYDAKQCRALFVRALEVAGLAEKGWEVVVDPKKANPATAANKKRITLPGVMERTPAQLRRLILHEMEDHARRGQNGEDVGLGILQKGTADYADVEEGLGVLLECVLSGNMDNPSFDRARDRYMTAGLAFGVGDTPRDARQTFEVLWRMFAIRSAPDGLIDDRVRETAQKQAYVHVENAFRGTDFAAPGIFYTKLKIYYEGLQKNAQFFREYCDDLDEAFRIAMLGKYNHTDLVERQLVMSLVA